MYIKLVGVYISLIHLQVYIHLLQVFYKRYCIHMYMKFIHLLLSNLIGQNVQAMVQVYIIEAQRVLHFSATFW